MSFLANRLYNAALMAGRPPTKEAPVFGQRLALLRKQSGYSQQRFAELLGTTRANIAYYERSAKNPTLDFIQRCSDVLQIDVSDLIDEDQKIVSKKKPGPKSELEKRFDHIRELPRSEQQLVVQFLDRFIKTS